MEFARTPCPVCGKQVIVVEGDDSGGWQYTCPGTKTRPCGKSFQFNYGDGEDQDDE